jgi:hypothetical protein
MLSTVIFLTLSSTAGAASLRSGARALDIDVGPVHVNVPGVNISIGNGNSDWGSGSGWSWGGATRRCDVGFLPQMALGVKASGNDTCDFGAFCPCRLRRHVMP